MWPGQCWELWWAWLWWPLLLQRRPCSLAPLLSALAGPSTCTWLVCLPQTSQVILSSWRWGVLNKVFQFSSWIYAPPAAVTRQPQHLAMTTSPLSFSHPSPPVNSSTSMTQPQQIPTFTRNHFRPIVTSYFPQPPPMAALQAHPPPTVITPPEPGPMMTDIVVTSHQAVPPNGLKVQEATTASSDARRNREATILDTPTFGKTFFYYVCFCADVFYT